MRFGPGIVIVLALLLSVGAALAGYLQGEIDSSGSTFRATWSVGVTTDYSVVDRIGNAVPGLSPLVVNEGPNSCNDDHPVFGNGRAYFVSAASDDTGPQDPDGWVDCELCDCEAVPGTNFWGCNSGSYTRTDGRCQQCDSCDAGGNVACGSRSDGETRCEHVTCSTYDCICDTTDCADRTIVPSCRDSVYDDECDESERVGYTAYSCSGDSCVGSPADRLCTRNTDGDSCDRGNGICEDGTCEACECDDCAPRGMYQVCDNNPSSAYCGFCEPFFICPEDAQTDTSACCGPGEEYLAGECREAACPPGTDPCPCGGCGDQFECQERCG